MANEIDGWLLEVKDNMYKLLSEDSFKTQERSLKENIEYYKTKMRYALNEKDDVMKRFYGIKSNHCRPMLVEAINIDRIIKKHGKNGLINISAWRTEKDEETNVTNTKNLIKDIQNSGYSYLPEYGGYRDTDKGEEAFFEPSFNVFNYNTKGEPQDFEKLKEFGVLLAKKYDQSSVLVKAPNEPPIWLDGDGIKVSKNETHKVFKNDPNQKYFTSLKSLEQVEKDKEKWLRDEYIRYSRKKGIAPIWGDDFEKFKMENMKNVPTTRRYTYNMEWGGYNECFVNPSPCTINERRMRASLGEILVDTEIL